METSDEKEPVMEEPALPFPSHVMEQLQREASSYIVTRDRGGKEQKLRSAPLRDDLESLWSTLIEQVHKQGIDKPYETASQQYTETVINGLSQIKLAFKLSEEEEKKILDQKIEQSKQML